MNTNDTIAAIATPSGRGGVGIIRISGPDVVNIAGKVLTTLPKPRYAELVDFYDQQNQVIDSGLALYFPNPNSFTGEDVLELQGHGGPVIMDLLLQTILLAGARLARPGEFSERAFLNNKIDLTQAEAIADLIDAASVQAARSATRSLQGEFSQKISFLVKQLIKLRVYVEASIDFPEEEIDFLSDGKVANQLQTIQQDLERVLQSAKQGRLLQEGMTIVIAGKPNAGKSSVLNCLSGQDSAIVTDVAGTTRDVLREKIQIDGLPLHIIDTAGLRESDDKIEQEGIRRAYHEIEKADAVLLVLDSSEMNEDIHVCFREIFDLNKPTVVVWNKNDLANSQTPSSELDAISISAKTADGIPLLKQALKQVVNFSDNNEGQFIARRRHLAALRHAQQALNNGQQQLQQQQAGELLAEDLRQAQQALNQITGEYTSDDLLGEIFSNFCIGK